MTDEDLLELAATLAERAAHAINAIRAAGFAVERKSDESPVTEADRVAEALIVEGLRAATPDIPVVAEEEVSAGLVTRLADRYWLVDPLDGTREFARGHDSFAVNVGLVRGDRAHLGAVVIPATMEIFGGIAPLGLAWKRDVGGRRPIRARAIPEEGATVLASRHYSDDPRLDRFLEGRRVAHIEKIGSAVKFCRLAEGAGDLYPRFGRTMEWDTAAPQALLEAAGGRVAGFDGAPLRYGKPGFENHPFLAQGMA
ncbi:3'(2'),5'-bisphosphate nucleotidase CysQ [Muricoccus pecuniae]|uniref:3'(2'),5'-bisphosphate nucleotidase CysQ n=1 Tax=Muricoccus pecuniae TaxID=693023 RepID=A0A840XZV8_9PROT|nr:3'(2'),5'-bisphosphate nucleotidase CysQ [Roseomonas pecuniae]MBB5692129.1 3'(2'), 5'-bisphosphate nucleotidase [Roseomonas pecuniae]